MLYIIRNISSIIIRKALLYFEKAHMVKRNFCAKMMVLTTVCCLFLTACHSSLSVEKRKHRKGYYFSISNDKVKTEARSESAILQKSSVAEKPFSQIVDSVIVDIMAAVVKPKRKVLQDTTVKQKRQCKMKIAKDSASRSILLLHLKLVALRLLC